ncbi:N-acetyltransferase [Exilibacterium tricleocarpae]|uniref:N-acetyltransferase n=1 Tax=Exilibacterium tricleocarpae TaxID=2591008 RepID=A0A545TZB9_9GAMM|nr:GNAT family N-acetyltransferase [Exilibacterium tricleocarpae]TQV82572.1 N-acetyltransferase [Exilibacterium tricleocarpae]
MQAEFIDSIDTVAPAAWQALWSTDYPFTRHGFLAALEHSGSTSAATGWQPCHLLLKQGQELVAALVLFKKLHSYGEYVFDWAWADAYQRSGLSYYPKLVTAIPFTPATGPRLGIAAGVDRAEVQRHMFAALKEKAQQWRVSSWHCLFPEPELSVQLQAQQFSRRRGCQFHWFNRGYENFEDFLSSFTSRKRKSLNRERRRVREQQIELEVRSGGEISDAEWRQFYEFYHLTYFKRSGRQGYLGPDFFPALAKTMPEQIVMVMARHHGDLVAAALNFRDRHTLYGRYWGCRAEFDTLHFEACYYQGIDYAIAEGLQKFDPGAQGEHKIQRGFTPVATWSNHWIADRRFRMAIDDFLQRENVSVEQYMASARGYLPFKQADAGSS